MKHKDMLGRDIQVGDYIVYSIRSGNLSQTKIGRVLELTIAKSCYHKGKGAIRLQGVEDYYGTGLRTQKPSRIETLANVVVVSADSFPENLKNLLCPT